MMQLRTDLEQRFKQELDELEERLPMPYVTSVERIAKTEGQAEGRAEGRAEGQAEGGAAVLLKLLTKRWGLLPAETQQQVRSLALQQQTALGEALLDFRTVQDLQTWLSEHLPTK